MNKTTSNAPDVEKVFKQKDKHMPKHTLSFKLPEERYELDAAIHGSEWKNVVYELDMFLRNALKHGHEFNTPDEALEHVRKALWDECKSYRLDPWED